MTTQVPVRDIPVPACAVGAALLAGPIGLGVATIGGGVAGYHIADQRHILGTLVGIAAGFGAWLLASGVVLGTCASANQDWLEQEASRQEVDQNASRRCFCTVSSGTGRIDGMVVEYGCGTRCPDGSLAR